MKNPLNNLLTDRKLPVLFQAAASECGLACLAMVACFYGYRTNVGELREKFDLSIEGCTLRDLVRFSGDLGFVSRPIKVKLEDVKLLTTPCILHWDLNHFVVLHSVKGDKFVIHDPLIGKVVLNINEFSKHFTGIALDMQPCIEFKSKKIEDKVKFTDFWKSITGLKSSLVTLFTFSVFLQFFLLFSPLYLQFVIDEVVPSSDTDLLFVLTIAFSLVLLFEIISGYARGVIIVSFGASTMSQITSNLFNHLIRLPISYFEKRHMGDIISRFASLRNVKDIFANGIVEALIDGFIVFFVVVIMLYYSLYLSSIVLFFALVYIAFRFYSYSYLRKLSEQEIYSQAKEQSFFMESVRAIQTIKLFSFEPVREAAWKNLFVNSINKSSKVGRINVFYDYFNKFIFGFSNILIVFAAVYLVLSSEFSLGMLFAFIIYRNIFVEKITTLIDKLIQFRMLSLHLERVSDIALSSKEDLSGGVRKIFSIKGEIEVRNLSYAYSVVGSNVLSDISFIINQGESVAIIGSSGCGKTTLMKILVGLIKSNSGQVLIDGHDISEIDISDYRSKIGVVMQDDQLLSGSIIDNITFFDDGYDMEWVAKCASLASIHEDILRMPMGYHSLIGDMGSALSGGQKQRLLIARALYRKPKMLFMDEATSHLDMETELKVNSSVKSLNITRVFIAHRKETIASADRVIHI